MPWLPDFVGAVELARAQTRAAGLADPVGQYVAAVNNGDTQALETVWPGEVVVYDPHAGEVRGHRHLRQFVHRSTAWLAERQAQVETVAATRSDGRAVVELLVRLVVDGRDTRWPLAVVAESPDDRSVAFRSYCSLVPVDGEHHVRPAILEPADASPGDVVGRYLAALAGGDRDAAVNTFAPDGYYREPVDPSATHRGGAELRSFFGSYLPAAGIGVRGCATTDDGIRCAVEYTVDRWGGDDLVPQAALAVFERDATGLLAAVRVYDDIEAPVQGAFGAAATLS